MARSRCRPCAWRSLILVVTVFVVALLAVPTADAKSKLPKPTKTLYEGLKELADYSTLLAAVDAARLSSVLDDPTATYTVLAPGNAAFAAALNSTAGLLCVSSNFTGRCASAAALLSSKSLPTLLLNHVLTDKIAVPQLKNYSTIKFVGGAVGLINKTTFANGSKLVSVGAVGVTSYTPVRFVNGWLYTVGGVLTADAARNATTIRTFMAQIADLGPDTTDMAAFNDTHVDRMAADVAGLYTTYRQVRNTVSATDGGYLYPMPMPFDVTLGYSPCTLEPIQGWSPPAPPPSTAKPDADEDLAFMGVWKLGALIRSKAISAVDLAKFFIARLKKYDSTLQATVTLTEQMALDQAKAADDLLANGTYLGPLHGIPYGLKDLISVPPYRTTWGSGAFIDQVIPYEAGVYKRLRAAGAVLIAKLATGEMASGDRWWGGRTRNPWNIAEGASGSSAGPGSAVSSGCVPFAIGSETSGSIISPSARNGITGLRPTMGLVGRSWAMALSQSCDKLGPMARSAADAALVFDVIRGKDPYDAGSCNVTLPDPFTMDVTKIKVAYINGTLPTAVLARFAQLNISLTAVPAPVFNAPSGVVGMVLRVESAAYFDTWLRTARANLNTNQDIWPVSLRAVRTVPAVEYVQAMRVRSIAIQEYITAMGPYDILLLGGTATNPNPSMTNFNGNGNNIPEMVIPMSFAPAIYPNATAYAWINATATPRKIPVMLKMFGKPYKDAEMLALAMAYQGADAAHTLRPPIDQVEPQILANCTFYDALPAAMRCNRPTEIIAKLNETGIGLPPVSIKLY